jgi:hypothetical protein
MSDVLVRALNFEPDNRTHGLTGGAGNGSDTGQGRSENCLRGNPS